MLLYKFSIFDEEGRQIGYHISTETGLQTQIGWGNIVPVSGDTYRWGFVNYKLEKYTPFQSPIPLLMPLLLLRTL